MASRSRSYSGLTRRPVCSRLLADARPRPVSRRISAGICDRDPFREQYGRHGGDDLDALFDRGPIGRVTRNATGPQAGRQAALRRTWAFTRAWNRALATPTHPHLVPSCGWLPPGPEDGRPYPLGRFRYDEASNGIRPRATSDDLYVPGMRTVGGLILPRGLIDSRKARSSGSNRHAGR